MDPCLHWLIQDLADVPDGNNWLSKQEQKLLSGLHFPKRRNDWRLGRWTAKCACRAYQPEIFPEFSHMEIIAAEDGGPDIYRVEDNCPPFSISISHSNNRGFCSVAPPDLPVGCDLEKVERRPLDFFRDYFTREEISFCNQTSEDAYPVVCYLIWSAKESSLKILREGLRRDTLSIQVRPEFQASEGSWRKWMGHCRVTDRIFYGWWRHNEDFVYTLAADRENSVPKELQTGIYRHEGEVK